MATATEVTSVITEIEAVASSILSGLAAVDPALSLPAAIVAEIGKLATTALQAFSAASGTPITVASVQALLPNPTPLTPPTS